MSKLANPWKCDADGCGILRANDTNHWLVIRCVEEDLQVTQDLNAYLHGVIDRLPASPRAEIVISKWDEALADIPGTKHACGAPCGLKLAMRMVMDVFFPAEVSTGKEVGHATD